jgi:tyrosyl-tRNA synthetase
MARSGFLAEASWRGFIFQATDLEGLDAAMTERPIAAYIGFDCTASSLHVGSLVQIMMLRLLQKHGHKPVVLLGGGTSRIGDPSGKDESRRLLSDEEIAANMAGIRRVFDPFLRFGEGETDAMVVNNADWLDTLGYIPLLRDVGTHFTVNRMLTFDSVRLRLEREQPLTFLEFNYMILQSYDFRELFRRHGVILQMGGSDQWGNIVAGVELIRRSEGKTVFGLTSPLITTASGAKMGKTAQGAVWLTANRLAPFDYWQFWRNTEDRDVGRFLRLFTELPKEEIERLETLEGAELNEAKIVLATEATALAHGREAAEAAREAARGLFGGEGGEGVEIPEVQIEAGEVGEGIPAFRLLVEAGLAPSNAEARRLIRSQGVRLDDALLTDEVALITPDRLARGVKLAVGRKRFRRLKLVGS